MTMIELDWIVDDYLTQLESALGPLSTSRRAQIVAEISEHVNQARTGLPTQDEASIRALLQRVGTPSEIAASALVEGIPPVSRHSRPPMKSRLFAVGLVVLLVAVCVVVYIAQNGSSAVTMPDVIGKSPNAAQSILMADGVDRVSVDVAPSLAPANTVFGTNTRIGARMGSHHAVTLEVSTGPSVVPNLTGLSSQESTRQLGGLGLRWAIVRVHRAGIAHIVVGQTPSPGSTLKKEAWVEIEVTSSSTAIHGEAPYLEGMPAGFAISELRSFGYHVHVQYLRDGILPSIVIGEAVGNVPADYSFVNIRVTAHR
jgi:serine/threonine-protein kinase